MAPAPKTPNADAYRFNRWLSITIVVGATLIGVALLFGFSFVHLFRGQSMPVDATGAERGVVVSAEFLEANVEGYLLRRDAESFRKVRFVNRRIELQYDYDQDGSVLRTRIFFADDSADTAVTYEQQRRLLQTMIESHPSPAKPEILDATFSWGEKSSFVAVRQGNELLGAYFVGVQGTTVFTFWMEGIDLQNIDILATQIQQSLFALETYQP